MHVHCKGTPEHLHDRYVWCCLLFVLPWMWMLEWIDYLLPPHFVGKCHVSLLPASKRKTNHSDWSNNSETQQNSQSPSYMLNIHGHCFYNEHWAVWKKLLSSFNTSVKLQVNTSKKVSFQMNQNAPIPLADCCGRGWESDGAEHGQCKLRRISVMKMWFCCPIPDDLDKASSWSRGFTEQQTSESLFTCSLTVSEAVAQKEIKWKKKGIGDLNGGACL